MYLSFPDAAAFVRLSEARIEQLIRDPQTKFPKPFQPQGAGGHRAFKQSELIDWMESKRAAYPQPSPLPTSRRAPC